MEKNERIYQIDILRVIAAFFVCIQHAYIGLGNNEYILAISRIGVPIFIITTGFLTRCENENLKKQIKKFFKIALEMFFIYFIIDIIINFCKGNIINYLRLFFYPKNIVAFFFFNDPLVADHSWYIWSMIYVFIIVKKFHNITIKKFFRNFIIIISLVLLQILGRYSYVLFKFDFDACITRNWLFMSLPYFLIGITMRENINTIKRLNTSKVGAALIVSILLCIVEKNILKKFNINGISDTYICTPIISILLFIYIYIKPFKHYKLLSYLGKEYSLGFYIIHPIWVKVEMKIFNMNNYEIYIGVMFVIIMTIITQFILKKISCNIRNKNMEAVKN